MSSAAADRSGDFGNFFASLRHCAKKNNVQVHLGGLEISEIPLRLCAFARKISTTADAQSR